MKQLNRYLIVVILITLISPGAVSLVLLQGQNLHLYSIHTSDAVTGLKRGDLIVDVKTKPELLRAGDVITYTNLSNQEITTERVIQSDTSQQLVAVRKAKDVAVEVPANSIIGRAAMSIPEAGYLLDALRNKIFLGEVIYLPTAFIVGLEARKLLRYYGRRPYHFNPRLIK